MALVTVKAKPIFSFFVIFSYKKLPNTYQGLASASVLVHNNFWSTKDTQSVRGSQFAPSTIRTSLIDHELHTTLGGH